VTTDPAQVFMADDKRPPSKYRDDYGLMVNRCLRCVLIQINAHRLSNARPVRHAAGYRSDARTIRPPFTKCGAPPGACAGLPTWRFRAAAVRAGGAPSPERG